MKIQRLLIAALLMIATFVSCSKNEVIEPKSSPEKTSKSIEMSILFTTDEPENPINNLIVNGVPMTGIYSHIPVIKGSTITITASDNLYIYEGIYDAMSRFVASSTYNPQEQREEVSFVVNEDVVYYISNVDKKLKPDMWLIADPELTSMIISGTFNNITMVPTRFNPDPQGLLYFELPIYSMSDCYFYKKIGDQKYQYYNTIPFEVEGKVYFDSGYTYLMTNNPNLDPNNPQN